MNTVAVLTLEKPRALADVDAVVDRLGLPRSSVYQMAREGRLPGTVRFGRRMKFDLDRLEAWLQAGGNDREAP